MPGDMLRNVATAAMAGCIAMTFVRKGAQKEILRIAVGILIILSVMFPLLESRVTLDRFYFPNASSSAQLRAEKEEIYQDALAETTEDMIEDYFLGRGMEVEVVAEINDYDIEHIIFYPKHSYEWTKEDAVEFEHWSGIAVEKQEWIWN